MRSVIDRLRGRSQSVVEADKRKFAVSPPRGASGASVGQGGYWWWWWWCVAGWLCAWWRDGARGDRRGDRMLVEIVFLIKNVQVFFGKALS